MWAFVSLLLANYPHDVAKLFFALARGVCSIKQLMLMELTRLALPGKGPCPRGDLCCSRKEEVEKEQEEEEEEENAQASAASDKHEREMQLLSWSFGACRARVHVLCV